MTPRRRAHFLLASLLLAAGVLLLVAEPAFAGPPDPVKTAKRASTEQLANLILLFVAVVLLGVGTGAATATLRVVFPDVAARADASVKRLGFARLLLTGVLPLIGAGLLGTALEKAGSRAGEIAFVVVVVIPLFLALLAGAIAALPHLGARLLKDGEELGVLRRAVTGGGVVGLSGATWVVPALGGFLSFVLLGWLVGVGIGAVFPAGDDPAAADPGA